jgi:SpoVK/Ycf46/Vps4 family AAA+-type ATPase
MIMVDSSCEIPAIAKAYTKAFELSMPGPEEILQIIRETLRDLHSKEPVELGITKKGLEAIVRNLRGLTRRQISRIITDTVLNDRVFSDQDINEIITAKRNLVRQNGLLEFVQAPLDINEIGGISKIKEWLRVRKDAFSPEALNFGIKAPKGVLILGVQGSGKSLCAKAIASAWQMPLLRLEPGVLYNKFIGESEKNLREALQYTELISPVVLWIDEIEKAFASAASHSVDGGLSQRMFGSLLTWMQERQSPVFLVATANNIEALPPELLRKGRFDEIFFVDLPGLDARKQILEIHLRKCKRDPKKFDLNALAQAAEGYSGAEIEQAIMSALNEAFACKTELKTAGVLKSLQGSPPISVTMAESIQNLIEWSKGRCLRAE